MKSILVFLMMTLSFSLFAKDGSSGCGPGWYLFKENSILSSSLRATTNGFLFPTTTIGMTVGSSNCAQHKLVMKEKESLHYVTNNYFEIQSETAVGESDYFAGLMETLGCSAKKGERLNTKLRERFEKVFAKPGNGEHLLFEIYNTILTDEQLRKACALS